MQMGLRSMRHIIKKKGERGGKERKKTLPGQPSQTAPEPNTASLVWIVHKETKCSSQLPTRRAKAPRSCNQPLPGSLTGTHHCGTAEARRNAPSIQAGNAACKDDVAREGGRVVMMMEGTGAER